MQISTLRNINKAKFQDQILISKEDNFGFMINDINPDIVIILNEDDIQL